MKRSRPGVRPATRSQRVKKGIALYIPDRVRGTRLSKDDLKNQYRLPLTARDEIEMERHQRNLGDK